MLLNRCPVAYCGVVHYSDFVSDTVDILRQLLSDIRTKDECTVAGSFISELGHLSEVAIEEFALFSLEKEEAYV